MTRRMIAPVVMAAVALVVVPAAGHGASRGPCAAPPRAGERLVTLRSSGLERVALLRVPRDVQAGVRVPLLLALHGYGGSGGQMERYSGLSVIAGRYRFLVAYPSSAGLYWNSNAVRRLPDDVAFLGQLIASLSHSQCIDPRRVFVTGVSNGGGMAALAGCRLSAQVAAIAPVAGGYDGQPPCRPAHPVSLLEIHGTADQVVGYFGGGGRPTSDGLPRFVNGWVARDGCPGSPRVTRIGVLTTAFRWWGCLGGTTVEHLRIDAGRHQWPGATPPDPGPPATISAAATIGRFLATLPQRRL
ncbi:MAG: CE1 family esterase [Solirubrobacteraceae bacterium]